MIAIGYLACAYVVVMIPILCFPAVKGADLNAASMNWTSTFFLHFSPYIPWLICRWIVL